MTYEQYLNRTDLLVRALASCALSRQDELFDKLAEQLDNLTANYPGYHIREIKK